MKNILFGLIFFVFGFIPCFWVIEQYLLVDKRSELSSQELILTDLKRENEATQKLRDDYETFKRETERLKKDYASLEPRLPNEAAVAALWADLKNAARANGLTIVSEKLDVPEPNRLKQGINEIPLKIGLRAVGPGKGSKHLAFLSWLKGYTRLVTVSNLKMTLDTSGESVLMILEGNVPVGHDSAATDAGV